MTMWIASFWARLWCSLCEASGIVEDVADDEEEPDRDGGHQGHPLAGVVILRIFPKVPISGQQDQADRRDMLLEVKESSGLVIMPGLERYPDGDTILRINVRADQEDEHV